MHGFETALSLIRDAVLLLAGSVGYGVAVWFLGLIFIWSGIAKLREPVLTAMAMVDFGVIRSVRPAFGLALGVTELLLAMSLPASLALGEQFHLALLFAAVLLWLFSILIVRSLQSGEKFACYCFGDTDSELSRWTLLRTIALALLATLLFLVRPGPNTLDELGAGETYMFEALAAVSLLATIMLASQVPNLLRWNADPLGAQTSSHEGGE